MINKTLLLILDGWGITKDKSFSAPDIANTPNFDNLLDTYPNAQLLTHEENVGLPNGQMGNSEVGHMNIGAGRIVLQDLLKINNSIKSGEFSNNENFTDIINYIEKSKSNVHLIGLLSDGGVHSHINHLKEILNTLSPTAIGLVVSRPFSLIFPLILHSKKSLLHLTRYQLPVDLYTIPSKTINLITIYFFLTIITNLVNDICIFKGKN